MKAKVFSGYVYDVEKEMCEWLSSTDRQILHFAQSTVGTEPVLTVTVIYKD
jgi:hypothetical protein